MVSTTKKKTTKKRQRLISFKEGQKLWSWIIRKKVSSKPLSYECICDGCGTTVKVLLHYDLLHGRTKICKPCSVSVTKQGHGMTKSSEYTSWYHMVGRCTNRKDKDYPNYGGRGIRVHPMWVNSFEAFFMYMGKKPDPSYTIERINVNKNYEPGNVKWATKAEQNVNKRDNVNITIDGITKTVSQWSRDPVAKAPADLIYRRIDKGWDPVQAVLTPKLVRKGTPE